MSQKKGKFLRKRKTRRKMKYTLIICFIIALNFDFFYKNILFIYNKTSISTNQKYNPPTIKIKNNDSTWLLFNSSQIIDNFMNLIPSQYGSIRQFFSESIKSISSLKVYSENDETNIKLLRDKLSEKFKKNSSLVKNIFITKTGGLGNQLCALNNIIFYSEILGIKNIYLNDAFNNWYIKNKIITNKLNISLANKNQINCNSEATFCGHIYFDFFFSVVFKPTARPIILKDEIKEIFQ